MSSGEASGSLVPGSFVKVGLSLVLLLCVTNFFLRTARLSDVQSSESVNSESCC